MSEFVHSKWHAYPLRVRYQETDQMGVVYHMNYLNWFEIGRTESIRSLGISYKQLEARGLLLPLTNAEMNFVQPARYDDTVIVYTHVEQFGRLRMIFQSKVCRISEEVFVRLQRSDAVDSWHADCEGELLVSCTTRHVWLNRSWQPTRLDHAAPDVYKMLLERL